MAWVDCRHSATLTAWLFCLNLWSDRLFVLPAGLSWGRASDPRTWEVGYFYQVVEKDALFAQFIDSDFGAGNTDARGGVIKAAYAPARNWVINATYMINDTNVDVPTTVAGVGSVNSRGYNRLQLDLNFRY